jgi:hypothetical protein
VIVFSIAIVASARAATTIARGIRLPRKGFSGSAPVADPMPAAVAAERPLMLSGPRSAAATPVARALESAARRDAEQSTQRTVAAASRVSQSDVRTTTTISGGGASPGASPLAVRPHLVPRHTRLPRASRAAARRDI